MIQNWRKCGLIFVKNNDAHYEYASLPVMFFLNEHIIRVYYSSRDEDNKSHPFFFDYNLEINKVINESQGAILQLGEPGCFDDNGITPTSIINFKNEIWLYYVGWNLGTTVPFRNSIGVAVSKDNGNTFNKLFTGPILDRNKIEPHFVASNDVLIEDGIWKMWYLSCIEWEKENGKLKHKYHIKYAESQNGIDWQRNGMVAIDFEHTNEYAISVPRVIKEEGIYKMWYSYRGNGDIKTYRIGYAESLDGKKWTRMDHKIKLAPSKTGWDSEMVCYPYILKYKNRKFMLYNGNNYGQTGIGLAVLE